jgi:hypothetical protein
MSKETTIIESKAGPLKKMREQAGIEVTDLANDHAEFLRNLSDLNQYDRAVVLGLHVLVIVVDGRISKGGGFWKML